MFLLRTVCDNTGKANNYTKKATHIKLIVTIIKANIFSTLLVAKPFVVIAIVVQWLINV